MLLFPGQALDWVSCHHSWFFCRNWQLLTPSAASKLSTWNYWSKQQRHSFTCSFPHIFNQSNSHFNCNWLNLIILSQSSLFRLSLLWEKPVASQPWAVPQGRATQNWTDKKDWVAHVVILPPLWNLCPSCTIFSVKKGRFRKISFLEQTLKICFCM